MSNHRILMDAFASGQSVMDIIGIDANESESLLKVADWMQGVAGGLYRCKIRFNFAEVQASNTVTFASFADGDTVTINGTALTGRTTPTLATEFAVGASNEACANNFMTKVNAITSAVSKIYNCVGAARRATVTISSMVAGNTVTVKDMIFTCAAVPAGSNQFLVGTSDTATAANLAAAINAHPLNPGVVATAASTVVTLNYKGTLTVANSANGTVASDIVVLYCIISGTIGNLCTLAISARGSVGAAAFSGGLEGTDYVFDKNYAIAV